MCDLVEHMSLAGILKDNLAEGFAVQGTVCLDDGGPKVTLYGFEGWLARRDDLTRQDVKVNQRQARLLLEEVGCCGFPTGDATAQTNNCEIDSR